MKLQELVELVALKSGLTKQQAKSALTAVVESISEVTVNEGKLIVPMLGTFKVSSRAARKGINPKTKEAIDIVASKSITFKASKHIKELLN